MLYPENDSARIELHSALAEVRAQDEESQRYARRLVGRATARGGWHAWVAGELLLQVLSVAFCSPHDATLGRAMHLYRHDFRGERNYEGGLVPASLRSLKAAWAEFGSIAHLSAGFFLQQPRNESGFASGMVVKKPNVPQLLAVAEVLRITGEHYRPAIGRLRVVPGKRATRRF
jgi:hypothetical protein